MNIQNFIKNNKHESSGQIIALLAISLLVLLIIAALAIDGGMLYSERRFSQNAADASSLAAAAWTANAMADQGLSYNDFSCDILEDEVMAGFSEAKLRAASNNFSNNLPADMEVNFYQDGAEHDLTEPNGMLAICSDDLKFIDFKVRITTETSTAFLHLIAPGTLKSTVEAVTRLEPQRNIGYGNAIVALNSNCSNTTMGLTISGTSEINITGGGLWSNACLRLNGPPSASSPLLVTLEDGAKANLIDPDGINIINGTLEPADAENIIPSEYSMDLYSDAYKIKSILEGTCNAFTNQGDIRVNNNNTVEITPGLYDKLTVNGDVDTTIVTFTNPDNLENPVYCFNETVTINGGTVTGDKVLIYLRGGDMSISANAVVSIRSSDVDQDYFVLDGLLIFMDPDDTNTISLEGGGTSYFSGTIFGLEADLDIGGNAAIEQTYSTQLIGKNVNVHGNVGIDINFDLSQNVTMPPIMNLIR